MKKSLFVLLLLTLFLFIGCKNNPVVEKITYEIDLDSFEEEIDIDDFVLSNIKIKATYQNGDFFFISIDESMLMQDDILKLKIEGEHDISVVYKNFVGSFHIKLINKIIPIENVFESSMVYYQAAVGKKGLELKESLRSIIKVTKKNTTYDDLRQDIAKTDVDPNNSKNIIMIYTGLSLPSLWDGGNTWTREHIWPQSLGWFTTSGAGADLHHLRPCEPGVNSSRGNKKYGEVGNTTYYEPRDAVKGDIARILFYLYVRYEQADGYALDCVVQSFNILLNWNEIDPVDDFEKYRNEKTYEIQGNRNPFIDHPECANLIWSIKVINFDNKHEIIIQIVWYNEKQKGNIVEDRV